jgi:hypothetical protein
MEESLNQLGEQGKLGERWKRTSLRLINTRRRLRTGANTHRGTESVPQIVILHPPLEPKSSTIAFSK